jgi:predicted pyridoxine 5'-phosphate oxidase superfamily flavin-nucleotide-binding protein
VRVLDDTTLAIPDRLGNRRADTFENVLRQPFVGVMFLIPGTENTPPVTIEEMQEIIVGDEVERLYWQLQTQPAGGATVTRHRRTTSQAIRWA